MVLWKRARKLKIYPKLVLSFLLLILPLYFISFLMNRNGEGTVRGLLIETVESQTQFYLSSLEHEFDRMISLRQQFLYDDDLQRLATRAPIMSQYERSLAILQLQERLRLFKNSSLYVQDVKAYIPLINRTVSTLNYGNSIPRDEIELLQEAQGANLASIVMRDGGLFMGQAYPEFSGETTTPEFAILVAISRSKLENMLLEIGGEYGFALLYGPDRTWMVGGPAAQGQPSTFDIQWLEESDAKRTVTLANTSYIGIYRTSERMDMTLAVFIPEQELMGPIHTHRSWIWVLSAVTGMLVLLCSYWIYQLIHRPLRKMLTAFRRVETGDLGTSIYHTNEDEFDYLYQRFNHMTSQVKQLIEEVYEQKIRSQRAELKQLQAQINPHFLYNGFFTLYRMAKVRDFDNVMQMAEYLSRYFRYVTRNAADVVPLFEEYSHARAYIDIQLFRFGGQVNCVMEPLPDEAASVRVPRLLLQPLLENAFQHGLEDREQGAELYIRVCNKGQKLRIEIEDNGESLSDEALARLRLQLADGGEGMETTGLLNVHRRVRLFFGAASGLEVSRGLGGGLLAAIVIERKE